MQKNGFTLIELLVVIVIIGLLAGIGIASFTGSIERSQYTTARSHMSEFIDLIKAARLVTNKTFGEISGSYCSECICRNKGPVMDIAQTDTCWTQYKQTLDRLNTATEGFITIDFPLTDPWGNPFLFNENEGEAGCNTDNLLSVGPDGTHFTPDDIIINIPVFKCSPSLGGHHADQNWE